MCTEVRPEVLGVVGFQPLGRKQEAQPVLRCECVEGHGRDQCRQRRTSAAQPSRGLPQPFALVDREELESGVGRVSEDEPALM